MNITDKETMWRFLQMGAFGNTAPFFSYDEWVPSVPYWGIRHRTIPGYPGTRLNVHSTDVPAVVSSFKSDAILTPMVWQFGTTLWEGDVALLPSLLCVGTVTPPLGSWREHMRHPREWRGSAAYTLLRSLMNENSFDDLMCLFDLFPRHVVEITILDSCFGTVPDRNAIIWEVRHY